MSQLFIFFFRIAWLQEKISSLCSSLYNQRGPRMTFRRDKCSCKVLRNCFHRACILKLCTLLHVLTILVMSWIWFCILNCRNIESDPVSCTCYCIWVIIRDPGFFSLLLPSGICSKRTGPNDNSAVCRAALCTNASRTIVFVMSYWLMRSVWLKYELNIFVIGRHVMYKMWLCLSSN